MPAGGGREVRGGGGGGAGDWWLSHLFREPGEVFTLGGCGLEDAIAAVALSDGETLETLGYGGILVSRGGTAVHGDGDAPFMLISFLGFSSEHFADEKEAGGGRSVCDSTDALDGWARCVRGGRPRPLSAHPQFQIMCPLNYQSCGVPLKTPNAGSCQSSSLTVRARGCLVCCRGVLGWRFIITIVWNNEMLGSKERSGGQGTGQRVVGGGAAPAPVARKGSSQHAHAQKNKQKLAERIGKKEKSSR